MDVQKKKHSLISLFSGYDSQALALRGIGRLGRLIAYADIKPAAVKAHEALWPGVPNLGDVSAIDWTAVEKPDILTYSFPCQDLSVMGNGKGMGRGSGTRSSLVWEVAKAVSALRPDYLLSENVSQCRTASFAQWLDFLGEEGYVSSLVTSDSWSHGSLQHRVRTFALSRRSASPCVASCRQRRRATWDDIVDRGDLGFPALDIAKRTAARSPKSLGRMTALTSDGLVQVWNGWADGGAATLCERDGINITGNLGGSNLNRLPMWLTQLSEEGRLTIRYLNGVECLRLMGVDDGDAYAIVDAVGNTHARCLAGDSIVLEQLEDMFEALLDEERGLPLPLGSSWQEVSIGE